MITRIDSMPIYTYFACLLLIAMTGCSHERVPAQQSDSIPTRRAQRWTMPNDFACQALRRFPASLQEVRDHADTIVRGDDHCVLRLIDSIEARIVVTGDTNYLGALDAICKSSDGYVSEYLLDLSDRIFRHRTRDVVDYMQRVRGSAIERTLVMTYTADIVDLDRASARKIFDTLRTAFRGDKEQMRYLNSLQHRMRL